ncbi:MAG: mandelate racemase/muconate lactonizing enzyme family protein [Dehalococcoidia bacterium]|jgi:L-alanine-DL-glutamate epimerase-like enolase superfamily enzyme|nr:mandelate racemase/muconate lactonizing enzyme family protein [Dehalococcoidia bacterium]
MQITEIETFVVDAGWRPWQFVAVRTDQGITGYGECSDGRNPYGIVGTVTDLKPLLLGRDPRPVEALYWDMYRVTRQSPGGIAAKAIAGIELALWDLKAKALGVPVYELFGGPIRERQRVYWSHCGTSRVRSHELIGVPPIDSYEALTRLGEEVASRGFTALKTNIVIPGEPARTYGGGFGAGATDQDVPVEILRHIERQLAALSDGAGPDVEIALDLNFHFKPEAAVKICRIAEQFQMLWVEIDMYDASALRQVSDGTTVPITSGENLYGLRDYRPYFEARSMDNVMVDIPWNGFSRSRDVALLAESYELNIAPHNYYSHMSTHIALHLCATVPNVRILEIDIDDVPWKDELTGGALEFEAGELAIPTGPGWGLELDEDVARAHVWEPGRGPGFVARSR